LSGLFKIRFQWVTCTYPLLRALQNLMKTESTSSGTVTQQDVARHLGVSRAWVGRALGGDPKITERSRERVFAAAKELGYGVHSNSEARMLAFRRNGRPVLHGAIGCALIGPRSIHHLPYWLELQGGIHEALDNAGLQLVLLRVDSKQGWEKVDGVLVHTDEASALLDTLPMAIPFAVVMVPAEGVPGVSPDEADGVRQAVRHLVELGHRRIGYLIHCEISDLHPDKITINESLRLAAYRDALQELGIEPQTEWVWNLKNYGDFVVRGSRSMRDWMKNGWAATGCTALLVQNDRAAIGAMQALNDAGYHVPEDVSIVGFDSTSECFLVRPNLTSIRPNLHDLGVAAVELLLRQIRGESAGTEIQLLPTQLEVRGSTGPPKADDAT
jgi:DNA-binding LacI/PurR family transcriptional regulator